MSLTSPNVIGNAAPDILVADLGGTWTRAILGSENVDVLAALKIQTPGNYEESISWIGMITRKLLDGKRPDAFGFGVAGEVHDGVITQAGQLTQYGWVGQDVATDIADEIGIEPGRVVGKNDMATAAVAQQVDNNRRGRWGDSEVDGIFTVSTGLGGALFTPDEIMPQEPGHIYLRPGAVCGDGEEGHLEAHASGSGFERKFGIRAEDVPNNDTRWYEFREDLTNGFGLLLDSYSLEGNAPDTLHFFGSVALKGPDILSGLQRGLNERRISAPSIIQATYGDSSGLQGAYFAANAVLID